MRIISLLVAAVQIFFVTLYYKETLLLLVVLSISAFVLLWSYSFSKQALLMFLTMGLCGFFAEAIVVTNGAWVYASEHILDLPVWLPIIWGSVGVVSINLVNRFAKA